MKQRLTWWHALGVAVAAVGVICALREDQVHPSLRNLRRVVLKALGFIVDVETI